MASVQEAFRRVTSETWISSHRSRTVTRVPRPCLTSTRAQTALMRIAALVAVDAPASSYRSAVAAAQIAGVRLEDLFAVLVAIGDDVGSARVISAAPRIALAAGYDVEAELE